MDIQRNIILVAIAVVGYLLLMQWMQDYPDQPAVTAQTNAGVHKTVEGSDLGTEQEGGGDLPPVHQSTHQEKQTLPSEDVVTRELITVDTGVLRLKINPVGGDVVGLSLTAYPVSAEQPDNPFVLLQDNQHVYVAQSGLIGKDGPDSSPQGRPRYQSFSQHYQMDAGQEDLTVDLSFQQPNGTMITKRFGFKRDSYEVVVQHIISNQSSQDWQGNIFAQIKRGGFKDPSEGGGPFAMASYLGAAYWSPESPYNKFDFDDFQEEPLDITTQGGWVAFLQHYFISAWVPQGEQPNHYSTRYLKEKGEYIISVTEPSVIVAPGQEHTITTNLYAGPKIQKDLKAITPGLDRSIDYGWLFFIAKPLFVLLNWIHQLVSNWGVSIILLTVMIKAVFYPLSAAGYRSMAKMRKVTPIMTRLREQYSDDKQKLSQEMMALYKKEKVNPMGGCLPILIQMPVFIALYWMLMESVELRQAPFFGWITDLSVRDPYFVLPILMAISMWIQTSLNPTPPDPMQAKMMKMMPIIFSVFFLFFPAGLVLYWLVNNILSISQQWYITKKIEAES